ncbi:agenet domain-containing protein [Forsythia ovata]|uniref:Agenet domain-containing protein n=1 Tax=Forsythia ovata TaxID=205694 RepID=A0ABD1PZS1_9LAMI
MANIDEDMIAQYFYKGAKVEISSKDEGFQGSWFQGTVLGYRKSKSNSCMKVLVRYKTLMKDKEGTRRLKEELDAMQLRPALPPENCRRFESYEEVDAYYHDGWWAGIITEVLGEDKYSVFFRDSREQRCFKAARLRRHREWVYGKWVPPPLKRAKVEEVSMSTEEKPKKETIDNNFSQGEVEVNTDEDGIQDDWFAAVVDKKSGAPEVSIATEVKPNEEIIVNNFSPRAPVEVSSDEDGFGGAWFPATIVKELDKGKYLIEYRTLRNDDDTELLREEVDSLHIRPCPPDIELLDRFEVLEEVEALYNDIWWVGVVSKVRKNDEYNVYFRSNNEELGFKHSDLRVHQEWINGKWIFPPKVQFSEY